MDRIEIDETGSVKDRETGLSFGQVWKTASGWHGRTAVKVGAPVVHLIRPSRRLAALATAAAYVLGYEGE